MIDLEKVIREISPSAEEEKTLRKTAETVLKKIKELCAREELDAEPVLVGSVSKGTYLDPDIDVFIEFDRKYDREAMVAAALNIGREVLPDSIERYAEHPYVSGHISGIKIDVVPCYRIKEGERIISAVDRSPLHTRYVVAKITDRERAQVRLLKAFMKTAGIYGSEVRTRGFSGYVCELLIISHRTFLNCLKSFSETRGKYVIPEKSGDAKKFIEPVIIIDPVDQGRNAAAAVSIENLSRMRVLSREFLRNPSVDYLERKRKPHETHMDRGTAIRIFRLPASGIVDDTIYPQAERFRNILVDLFAEGGFSPIGSEIDLNDHIDVLIECEREFSPMFFVHKGPPADSERTHEFISKWIKREDVIGPYISGDRLYVDVPLDQHSIEDYVMSRLPEFNIGAHLNDLKNELEIIDPSKGDEKFSVMEKFFSRSIF